MLKQVSLMAASSRLLKSDLGWTCHLNEKDVMSVAWKRTNGRLVKWWEGTDKRGWKKRKTGMTGLRKQRTGLRSLTRG
jgi:hypothetical protein